MNAQIRKLMIVVILMTLALLSALTYVQFVQAPTLNADGRNARTVYQQYGQERGKILVGDQVIAESTPVDDRFKYLRTYPSGATYAAVTGFFPTGLAGAPTGLEAAASSVLTGRSSALWMQRLQDLFTGHQPQGGNISLTLQPAVQQAAIEALNGKIGAVVALNPSTGAILGLYSSPSFDPNALSTHDAQAAQVAYSQLLADPNKPLENRAIAGNLFAPGSSFKIVTTAALLAAGQVTPATIVDAPTELPLPNSDKKLPNYGGLPCGSGKVTFEYAFQMSCNTAFADQAMKLGTQPLMNQAQAFGFGQKLDIPLAVTPSVFPEPAAPAFLANASIGQQDVRATPLQMAMVAAAIANNGTIMRPYLVAQELNADLEVVKETTPSEFSQATTPEIAATIKQMMQKVVTDGTGKAAALPGVAVAGKTGTAEGGTPQAGNTAWFVGFAPAENPKIALAMVVQGSPAFHVTGGETVAPLARGVFAAGVNLP